MYICPGTRLVNHKKFDIPVLDNTHTLVQPLNVGRKNFYFTLP